MFFYLLCNDKMEYFFWMIIYFVLKRNEDGKLDVEGERQIEGLKQEERGRGSGWRLVEEKRV